MFSNLVKYPIVLKSSNTLKNSNLELFKSWGTQSVKSHILKSCFVHITESKIMISKSTSSPFFPNNSNSIEPRTAANESKSPSGWKLRTLFTRTKDLQTTNLCARQARPSQMGSRDVDRGGGKEHRIVPIFLGKWKGNKKTTGRLGKSKPNTQPRDKHLESNNPMLHRWVSVTLGGFRGNLDLDV